MKKKVKLVQIGQRTKAKVGDDIIKTVPKPFVDIVKHVPCISQHY